MLAGGIPGCRWSERFRCPCTAGVAPPSVGLQHTFWDCRVACAVRQALSDALGGGMPTRGSLWLLTPPRAGVCAGAWRLVALAALHAMEHGRRHLWASRHQNVRQGMRIGDGAAVASQSAVGRFWLVLHEFVAVNGRPLPDWQLDDRHPVICVCDGRLVVRQPI